MKKWVWLSVSWFGVSGKFSFIRGTWGTLAALPFAAATQFLFGAPGLLVGSLLIFMLGVIASNHYVAETGKQDPGEIVIDEVAATFLLLAFLPFTWSAYALAFVVFRIFDVIKPFPVSLADKHIKGGFGVMFDDILAALYPVVLAWAASHFAPETFAEAMAWIASH